MGSKTAIIARASLLALILASANTYADGFLSYERIVRCDRGQNVQHVLDRNRLFPLPLVIKVVGNCDGFTVLRDDVTIQSPDEEFCDAATILGTVTIDGARRTKLSCLQLDGIDTGLVVRDGDVELNRVDINGIPVGIEITQGGRANLFGGSIRASNAGVAVERGTVEIEGTSFRLNGFQPDDSPIGLRLDRNSHATLRGASFEYLDQVRGRFIDIRGSSSIDIEDTVMYGNSVSSTGLLVLDGSNARLTNVFIYNHRFNGIRLRGNSSMLLEGGEISGNDFRGVRLDDHSWATINDASIVGNGRQSFLLTGDSGLRTGGELFQADSFECADDESSVQLGDGSTPVGCTGF
jgi:hypothetical protein